MGNVVKFKWENGCVHYIVIIKRNDSGAVLFLNNGGVASMNPESMSIGQVPDPGGAPGSSVTATVIVVYEHTNGNSSSLTRDFTIDNN